MNNYTISVAMTTFNGEKYIYKQLLSIFNQTRIPDEVIICDDCSQDETVKIIEDFISSYSLENWKILVNPKGLGWKRNFYKAISLTSGDIVFFSDQDDIWIDNKIEIMSDLMRKYNMSGLHGGKQIIDQDDVVIKNREEKSYYTNNLVKYSFQRSFYDIITLGCCMCVSRDVIDIYVKLDFPEGGHDSQCGRLANIYGSLYYIDRPVIKYRIHTNNTSGISAKASYGHSTLERRVDNIRSLISWIDKLENLDKDHRRIIMESQRFLCKRLNYLEGKASFWELIKNYAFYRNLTSLVGDYAYKHGINKIFGELRWKINKIAN